MEEDKYKGISYMITGAVYEVHRELGCGFLERVYQEALAVELSRRGLPFEREKALPLKYKGVALDTSYIADFIVNNSVILEIKAVDKLCDAHRAQIINYLHATNLEFGMLINFGAQSAQIERFANSRNKNK